MQIGARSYLGSIIVRMDSEVIYHPESLMRVDGKAYLGSIVSKIDSMLAGDPTPSPYFFYGDVKLYKTTSNSISVDAQSVKAHISHSTVDAQLFSTVTDSITTDSYLIDDYFTKTIIIKRHKEGVGS